MPHLREIIPMLHPDSHYVVCIKYEFWSYEIKIKATEEMVAFLAFIGFYIFGICIHEIWNGLFQPSIEQIRKESRENNKMHYLII